MTVANFDSSPLRIQPFIAKEGAQVLLPINKEDPAKINLLDLDEKGLISLFTDLGEKVFPGTTSHQMDPSKGN